MPAVGRLALLTLGGLASLLLAEGVLRAIDPYRGFGAATEHTWYRENVAADGGGFVLDAEMGFRPRLGTPDYGRFGTQPNAYPIDKRPGVTRLLFVGDSVVRRGRIVEALRQLAGEERHEYWNAGVEAFSPVEEVIFYERYNAAIDPDHVILTLHNNDLRSSHIAFESEGRIVLFSPHLPVTRLSPWLFQHSRLYRIALGLRAGRRHDLEALAVEVRASLARLQQLTAAGGRTLTVVLLPILAPRESWLPDERRSYELEKEMLDSLGIRHFDLLAPLEQALAAGVDVQEVPGDTWHPSDAVARRFARHLLDAGLLGGVAAD